MLPETKSRNSGDHELWNHEMRGPPVYNFGLIIAIRLSKIENLFKVAEKGKFRKI